MRTRYWLTVVLAGFAIYSTIAVLGAVSSIVYFTNVGAQIDWNGYVANRFLEQYTCALFVAPLFWIVDRFPLTASAWRRNIVVVLAVVVSFIALKYTIMLPLYRLWAGKWGDAYWLTVVENAVPVAFDFFATIGVAHALRYSRDIRERERSAAELETQLVQARLDALRGQLHPHFLFNALNAVATLMHEDVDAADRMVTQLAELLRISLERGESEIPLREELELARRYLAIMEHRFSDRLTTHCSADPGVANALVPTFVLQPLIENALEHGIARHRGPGRIEILVRRNGDSLEIVVSDNGPGATTATPGFGIGLSNTRARLNHLYDHAAALVLEPAPGGGTRAVIQIPFRECAAS